MSIQTRIAHTGYVQLVRLPLHRITRELFLLVFEREDVLEDVDLGHLPGQATLTIEQPVPKFGIACFVQEARLTDRRERLMHERWLRLDPFHPTQNLSRTMAAVLPLFVGHMTLEIVVDHPFVVSRQQIFPGLRLFKAPVGHTPLHTKRRFYIILIGSAFFDLFFLDAELLADAAGCMGDEDTAVIRDQDFRNAMLANRRVCYL